MRKIILLLTVAMLQFTANAQGKNRFDIKSLRLDAAAPTITSFSPAFGSVGTLVTITRTNLNTAKPLSIRFGFGKRQAIILYKQTLPGIVIL